MHIIGYINEEYHHLNLWYFVSFIFGILAYFSLQYEPAIAYMAGLIFCSPLTLFLKRYGSFGTLLSGLIISFSLGAGVAKYRAMGLEVEGLKETITTSCIGTVSSIKQTTRGSQVVLDKVWIKDHKEITKVRINIKAEHSAFMMMQDRVKIFATLTPPPRSILPGGYDFGFYAWFSGIQATGYALSAPKEIRSHPEFDSGSRKTLEIPGQARDDHLVGWEGHLKTWSYHLGEKWKQLAIKAQIQDLRRIIYNRLLEHMGELRGNFAAAIILGEGSGLDRKVMQNMRYAGISHILCVSGLHLSLVAMLFFISSRFLLNLSDKIAFRFDIKTFAAIISLIGSFGYLLLSGTQIAATRAFIMTSIFILSVIIGRSPYPLRSICIAAAIILTVNPEYVLHPSFQLSFIAVLSLITGYEFYIRNQYILGHGGGILGAVKLYIFSNIYSSIVASLATTPIVIYHFYISSNYSVMANLIAVPIMSFFMMPLAILALISMPFGLDYYILQALGFFVQIVIDFAAWICSLPRAVWYFGYVTPASIIVYIIGFFWLTLWQQKWRHFGWIIISISVILMFISPKPDAIYDPKLNALGVKDEGGKLEIYAKRMSRFSKNYWANWFGQESVEVNKDVIALEELKKTLWGLCHPSPRDLEKYGAVLIFDAKSRCRLVYDKSERFKFR